MRGVKGSQPPCMNHPDRPQKARGLCNACYQRSSWKDHRAVNLRHFYKMTRQDEQDMLAKQGGACASCGDQFVDTPRVDHDHTCCPGHRSCGECVRGLLCDPCNKAAGWVQDDPNRALALAAYLLQHQDVLATLGGGSDQLG